MQKRPVLSKEIIQATSYQKLSGLKKSILLFAAILFMAFQLVAAMDLSGRIVNEEGEGVYDATIMIKGSVLGVKSDNEGYFNMNGMNFHEHDTLVITSVGYTMQEVPINGRDYIEVVLKKYFQDLDEVVVSTGYQKLKKEQLTGAVSMMDRKAIDQRINVSGNLLESMEGKLAGLVYNPNSGELSIRGVSSFNAVKQPLVVIDGFITEIGIEALNPNDVASISVLRDAAAAAIYGARASNGVIVVTTRRGKAGKIKFSARAMGTYRLKNNVDDLNFLAGKGFIDIERKLAAADSRSNLDQNRRPYSPIYDAVFSLAEKKITEAEAQAIFDKYAALNNRQQYEDIFLRNELAQQYDFDFSGGNERATFITSVNHVRATGTTFGNDNNRTVLSLKGIYSFNKNLSLDFGVAYVNSRNKRTDIPEYKYFKPYEMFRDAAGNVLPAINQPTSFQQFSISQKTNLANMENGLLDMLYYPAQDIHERYTTNTLNAIRTQAMFSYKLLPGISVDFGGVYEMNMLQTEKMSTRNAYYTRQLQNLFTSAGANGPEFNIPLGDILGKSLAKTNHYTGRVQLNVDKTFKDMHNINLIAGAEIRQNKTQGNGAAYFGYDDRSLASKPVNLKLIGTAYRSPYIRTLGAGGVDTRFPVESYINNSYFDDRFVSGYADGSYILLNKYIFKGSFRVDQSNLFGADPKYRFKPLWSAGFAWRLSQEAFIKDMAWLNDLKVRGSYGFQGNTATNSSPFLIMRLYNSFFIPTNDLSSDVEAPPNKSLRWETSGTKNLGLDFAAFDNRINLTVDYYDKISKDLLANFDKDPTVGFNEAQFNIGKIRNKGWEISLATQNIASAKFRWSTQLTASFNNNNVLVSKTSEITASYQKLNTYRARITEGYPLDAMFSYQFAGLNDKGQPMVYDIDGSKKVLTSRTPRVDIDYEAMVYSGTSVPRHVLGLNNQLSFGPVDLSFLFMYYGGHVMRLAAPSARSARPIQGAENYWQKPGDENTTTVPSMALNFLAPDYYDFMAEYGYNSSDKFIARANFLRLRDVILTYNIQNNFSKKIGMESIRLRFQAQNLLLVPFYAKDTDPETFNLRDGSRNFKLRPAFSFAIFTDF